MIKKLNSSYFDWLTWICTSPTNVFGFNWRTESIVRNKRLLKKYAVGYCKGEYTLCRPKLNYVAVMFFKNGDYFWYHMTDYEFNKVFK